MPTILNAYQLNPLFKLRNRILMAPMTRVSADVDLVPTQKMAAYYARRAQAGLIITEGTIIERNGLGYANVPGIFTEAQVQGWQHVTKAVHAREGLIFLQIWHTGRVSHPALINGAIPISASETVMTGKVSRSEGLFYGKSRAASLDEIKALITQYETAAKNAIEAGFDGVEIHGANGYLIDQFLHFHTNKRDDLYGGAPENMARFALEIVRACGAAIGFERVAIRLSPGGYLNEIVGDKRDAAVFKYLFQQLNTYPIAYVHTGNFDDSKTFAELDDKTMTAFIRTHYKGNVVAAGGYTADRAEQQVQNNEFDLVAIGRPFIANHDLIDCITYSKPLQSYDVGMLKTLY